MMQGWYSADMKQRPSGMLVGLFAIAAVAIIGYAVLAVVKPQHVTTAAARRACEDFYSSTKSEVQAAPDYQVIESGKHCETVQDESGYTDYKLGAYFRLTRTDGAALTRQQVDEVAARLPSGGGDPWQLDNELATPSQPEVLCISTSKYLNNDGTYIDQHFQDKLVKFHEAGSQEPYVSLCAPSDI